MQIHIVEDRSCCGRLQISITRHHLPSPHFYLSLILSLTYISKVPCSAAIGFSYTCIQTLTPKAYSSTVSLFLLPATTSSLSSSTFRCSYLQQQVAFLCFLTLSCAVLIGTHAPTPSRAPQSAHLHLYAPNRGLNKDLRYHTQENVRGKW